MRTQPILPTLFSSHLLGDLQKKGLRLFVVLVLFILIFFIERRRGCPSGKRVSGDAKGLKARQEIEERCLSRTCHSMT